MQSSSVFAWVAIVLCLFALRMEHKSELQLAPGDEVHIKFANQPEWNTDARLADDGSIAIPNIGRIQLAGLSRMLAESYLAERLLSNGVANAAQVDIEVVRGGSLRLAETNTP